MTLAWCGSTCVDEPTFFFGQSSAPPGAAAACTHQRDLRVAGQLPLQPPPLLLPKHIPRRRLLPVVPGVQQDELRPLPLWPPHVRRVHPPPPATGAVQRHVEEVQKQLPARVLDRQLLPRVVQPVVVVVPRPHDVHPRLQQPAVARDLRFLEAVLALHRREVHRQEPLQRPLDLRVAVHVVPKPRERLRVVRRDQRPQRLRLLHLAARPERQPRQRLRPVEHRPVPLRPPRQPPRRLPPGRSRRAEPGPERPGELPALRQGRPRPGREPRPPPSRRPGLGCRGPGRDRGPGQQQGQGQQQGRGRRPGPGRLGPASPPRPPPERHPGGARSRSLSLWPGAPPRRWGGAGLHSAVRQGYRARPGPGLGTIKASRVSGILGPWALPQYR